MWRKFLSWKWRWMSQMMLRGDGAGGRAVGGCEEKNLILFYCTQHTHRVDGIHLWRCNHFKRSARWWKNFVSSQVTFKEKRNLLERKSVIIARFYLRWKKICSANCLQTFFQRGEGEGRNFYLTPMLFAMLVWRKECSEWKNVEREEGKKFHEANYWKSIFISIPLPSMPLFFFFSYVILSIFNSKKFFHKSLSLLLRKKRRENCIFLLLCSKVEISLDICFQIFQCPGLSHWRWKHNL